MTNRFMTVMAAVLLCVGLHAQVAKDVRYAPLRPGVEEGRSSDRLLDIYIPSTPAPSKGYPTVMFVHGGGFRGGDKSFKPITEALVQRGYAVVSINYILSLSEENTVGTSCRENMSKGLPESGAFNPVTQRAIDLAAEDAALALKWIGDNASLYGIDRRRIAVCGGSAGSMTCLELAYGVRPRRPRVRAVVNLWGSIADPGVIRRHDPPVLTLHGDTDELVSVEYAQAIRSRVKALGRTDCQTIIMEGRGHAQYRYVSSSKEIMDTVDAFLSGSLRR